MKFIILITLLLVSAAPAVVAKPNVAHLQVEASRKIRDQLNDPRSFEWGRIYKKDSKELGFVIYGFYRAKNSFGGMVTGRFIYNGQTLLLSEVHGRFEEAWNLI